MTTNNPEVEAYLISDKGDPSLRSVRRAENHDASLTSTSCLYEPLIRLSDYEALQDKCEKLRGIISDMKDWDCDVSGGFLSIPVDLRRRMQEAINAARQEPSHDNQ